MKLHSKKFLSSVLAAIFCLSLLSAAGCAKKQAPVSPSSGFTSSAKSLWDTAKYKSDITLGNGKKTISVEITAEEKSVLFTIKTDTDTLADALLENKLVAGEQGDYGLYIQTADGIYANYDKDKAYWAFYKDGDYLMTGADATKITDGDKFKIAYEKSKG